MNLTSLMCGLSVFLLSVALSGCDSGGSDPEVMSNQSEIDKYLSDNPNFDEGMDDGSTEDPEE